MDTYIVYYLLYIYVYTRLKFVAGKTYTMIGSPEDPQTYGIIPCAISWLFKGIQEQKARTGARFSVRVSAVEVSGPASPVKDLLAGQSNGNYTYIYILYTIGFTHTHTYVWFPIILCTKYRAHLDFRKPPLGPQAITSRSPEPSKRQGHIVYIYMYILSSCNVRHV